jgi:hypothetical protein
MSHSEPQKHKPRVGTTGATATIDNAEVQRGEVTCSKSHSKAEGGIEQRCYYLCPAQNSSYAAGHILNPSEVKMVRDPAVPVKAAVTKLSPGHPGAQSYLLSPLPPTLFLLEPGSLTPTPSAGLGVRHW